MLAEERQQRIAETLRERGTLRVVDLAEQFGVSRETIRRDLAELESKGLGRKVHGGVMLDQPRSAEPPYSDRSVSQVEAKRAIGRAAAAMIQDGESILLDLGTTTLEVARHLRGRRNLTVLTNSLPAAMALVEEPGITVFLTGGQLRPGDLSLSGTRARDALNDFYVDRAVVGAGGISVETGLTDYHVEESAVRRLMIQRAREVMVVADHTKFGVTAFAAVCRPDEMDYIVTDAAVDAHVVEAFEAIGVTVTVVEADEG